jgi:hypothetical protein
VFRLSTQPFPWSCPPFPVWSYRPRAGSWRFGAGMASLAALQ